jgi:hypothetical protein
VKKQETYRPTKTRIVLTGVVAVLCALTGVFFNSASLFFVGLAVAIIGVERCKRLVKKPPSPAEPQVEKRAPTPPRPSQGEGHVASFGLSVERRLEQLDSLKSAGLVEREEYDRKRKEILGQR